MDGPTYIVLEIDHVDQSANLEWDMDPEEILGGTGRCTLNVQDRTNTYEPPAHVDVKLYIRASGHVLFRGEILTVRLELPDGMPFRIWHLDCADYNGELPQRKVGAFDGITWIDEFGLGVFINVDPFADSLETDKLTVQTMLDHYFRVDGTALETSTFVQEYLPDMPSIGWSYSDLKAAFEEMAALIVDNLQFWIDPDLFFHWVTIPPWQSLAGVVAMDAAPATQIMTLLFPQSTAAGLPNAPANVTSDLIAVPGGIGFSKITFTLDGGEMPEQVYVRGGTGYVYNAPPLSPADDTKTVVKAPTQGAGQYELTFLATTKIWHLSGGYIDVSFDTVGASGPYQVKWVYVPWNEARHKGGHFWKLLEGPNAGKFVDDHTNGLTGYGQIVVHKNVGGGPVPPPEVGIGGSGWTGEALQDPNKRQAFLEAPISTTRAKRDAMGGQAIYRGQFPTLRGSMIVRGIDGWRAGQIVQITDPRLPSYLNGNSFLIQRVKTKVLAETNVREYTLDWGDGPTSRYSARGRGDSEVGWPDPAIQIVVEAHDLSPGPNSTQTITGQLVNGLGEPWGIKGKVVNWSVECYNNLGVLQPNVGTVLPEVSLTNKHGKARTVFTSGPGTNLVYFIFASVVAT